MRRCVDPDLMGAPHGDPMSLGRSKYMWDGQETGLLEETAEFAAARHRETATDGV